MKQTAMIKLLNHMREERSKMPIPIEWDRCYQAIEMMIEHTYIPMEKKQIDEAWWNGSSNYNFEYTGEKYYQDTYAGDFSDSK